jgi:hypothetical protein
MGVKVTSGHEVGPIRLIHFHVNPIGQISLVVQTAEGRVPGPIGTIKIDHMDSILSRTNLEYG